MGAAGGYSFVVRLFDAERVRCHRDGFGATLSGDLLVAQEGPDADQHHDADQNQKAARTEEGLAVLVFEHQPDTTQLSAARLTTVITA